MEMHKQTGEMIFSTLTNSSMNVSKLWVSLTNIQSQLKIEKLSYLAKYTRIKSLEDLVIRTGYNPKNVKAVEELIKKKSANIASLRNKLKMSVTEDPQTKDIEYSKTQKEDMLKLIMEHNAQIKNMEE